MDALKSDSSLGQYFDVHCLPDAVDLENNVILDENNSWSKATGRKVTVVSWRLDIQCKLSELRKKSI